MLKISNVIAMSPDDTEKPSGSGSTLIASEQTGRVCHTIELDEKYVDVIVKRYIEFTGSDEEVYLLRDGEKIKYKDVEKPEEILI